MKMAPAALALIAIVAVGCDSYPKAQVHCQIGESTTASADDRERARCEFTNLGKTASRSCIQVEVVAPDGNAFLSPTLCSGTLLPDVDRDGVADKHDRCPDQGRHASPESGLKGSFAMDAQGCPTSRMTMGAPRPNCRSGGAEATDGPNVGVCQVEVFPDSKQRAEMFAACNKHSGIVDGALLNDAHFECEIKIKEVSF